MTGVPARWVSIDPGNSHVGFAQWEGSECVAAFETTPRDAEDRLIASSSDPWWLDLIVVEDFTLYAHLARLQAGKRMLTSELIGAIELIGRLRGVPVLRQSAAVGKRVYSLEPYRSAPQRWWPSYGHGEHTKDAVAHGYSYLLRVHKLAPEMTTNYGQQR